MSQDLVPALVFLLKELRGALDTVIGVLEGREEIPEKVMEQVAVEKRKSDLEAKRTPWFDA